MAVAEQLHVAARLGLGDADAVDDGLDLGAAHLLLDALREEQLARRLLHLVHALLREGRHVQHRRARGLELRDALALLRGEHVGGALVDLVDGDDEGLAVEERLDRLEERHLLRDREAALLRDVDHVEHAALQVRERGDRLHLDRVALLEGLVEDARRVDDLPAHVLVVHVAHVQRLGRERVRLHLDVGARHLVHEGRLADVRVARDDDRARGGVDGGEAHHVLPDLLEVLERAFLPLHDRAHAAQRRALQRLAPVERVAVLEQLDVVAADAVDELARDVHLAEGELEVVAVVEDVHQVRVERVDVVQPREVRQDLRQLLVVVGVRVLDLAHVKLPDADDVVARVDDGRRLPLRLGEYDVDEVLSRRHGLDLLELRSRKGGPSVMMHQRTRHTHTRQGRT